VRRIPVLLYHAIGDVAPDGQELFTVPTATLASHLDLALERGLTVVGLGVIADALLEGRELPPDVVGLTFDDGYADFAANAAPVIAERGVGATLFQTTGCIGGHHDGAPMLTATDLVDLAEVGIEIGAHSVTHPHLDVIAPARRQEELRASRERLEDLLQRPVHGVAYPHGSHDRATKSAAGAAGYRWAAAVKNAFSHPGDDPWSIARLTITSVHSADDVAALLDGRGAPVSWVGERLRTTVFRQVRRARTLAGRTPHG
jgi:peptidoglycan/xylan/chitin deacetylase (PgdA/CDA1 family)